MSDTLLTLRDVHINFPARKNWLGKTTEHVHAINGIDLQIRRGETLGIVGESGCGKSTLAQLLMGMLQPSHGQYIRSGSQRIMQMVFQDPLSSLNPRLPVWRIITEPLWIAKRSSEQQRRALAEELAVQVGIRPEYLDRLPHAFSGGQRQRIAIARALSSQPDVIVLDEPTSALDISVQAQILNLLVTLQENHGLTYVLISHNVSVIRHMSDRVAVMYLGQIVELGEAQQVLTAPAHPYTRLLLDSLPAIDKPLEEEWALRKTDLPGNRTLPQGCFFRERCPLATSGCGRTQYAYSSLNHWIIQFQTHCAQFAHLPAAQRRHSASSQTVCHQPPNRNQLMAFQRHFQLRSTLCQLLLQHQPDG